MIEDIANGSTKDLSYLAGEHVIMWPYARGVYPPDTLYRLWKAFHGSGMVDLAFYGSLAGPERAVPHDLEEMVSYLSSTVLLIAQSKEHDEIAGAFWFSGVSIGAQAAGNCFYLRKFWGDPAREATRIAFNYGFEELDLQQIWGFSPWMTAIKHAVSCGAEQVATLPDFIRIKGVNRAIHVCRITREKGYG